MSERGIALLVFAIYACVVVLLVLLAIEIIRYVDGLPT